MKAPFFCAFCAFLWPIVFLFCVIGGLFRLLLRLSAQMLLLADCIRFANPCGKFVVEFRQTIQPKRVQMISRREGFNPQKAWALSASRENKVTDEIVVAHLHDDERHTHLKSDARFLWQHF